MSEVMNGAGYETLLTELKTRKHTAKELLLRALSLVCAHFLP